MFRGDWFDKKYRLERILGRGASGEVWFALDATGAGFVIKRLRSSAGAELRARFARELEVARALGPPHFSEFVDGTASASGPCYVVWRDAPGTLLPEWASGNPPVSERVRLVSEILTAVSTLHSQAVVHRDLKPEHLLLRGSGQIALLDLGLCRVEGGDRITASRHVLGSAAFVAPEQVTSPHRVDARADLYSVGAIAFWLLTGRVPIWAPTAEALLTLKLMRPAPRLFDHCEDPVSDELDDWVAGMLSADPTQRPESAEAARAELPSC